MSKARANATIHCRTTIGKRTVNRWTEHKTVYTTKDGAWVSYLGVRKGRRAHPNPDGSYTVDYTMRPYTLPLFVLRRA
jgi:hypothetical protein